MQNAKVNIVVDLEGPVKRSGEQIRDELKQIVTAANGNLPYGTNYQGRMLRHVGGSLIDISFADWSRADLTWPLFSDLTIVQVRVTDEGTEHFPEAGVYHYSSLRRRDMFGASAMVTWTAETSYPASETYVESVIQATFAERVADSRITIPVVVARKWQLALVAPSLKRAGLGYELLRSGRWAPRARFADAAPDVAKVRQVSVSFESGNPLN